MYNYKHIGPPIHYNVLHHIELHIELPAATMIVYNVTIAVCVSVYRYAHSIC